METDMTASLIQARNLTKSYRTAEGVEVHALDHVDAAGELTNQVRQVLLPLFENLDLRPPP